MIEFGIHPSVVTQFHGKLKIPETTVIEPMCVLYGGPEGELCFGERNILYPACTIRIEQGYMKTGMDVSFGPGCHIYEPRGGLEIGDNCLIAGGALICGVEHSIADLKAPIREQPKIKKKIIIEPNVWIGMRVTICPGVTIGEGAVIGAGSVVMHDIPANSVAFGTPCAVVRKRK